MYYLFSGIKEDNHLGRFQTAKDVLIKKRKLKNTYTTILWRPFKLYFSGKSKDSSISVRAERRAITKEV